MTSTSSRCAISCGDSAWRSCPPVRLCNSPTRAGASTTPTRAGATRDVDHRGRQRRQQFQAIEKRLKLQLRVRARHLYLPHDRLHLHLQSRAAQGSRAASPSEGKTDQQIIDALRGAVRRGGLDARRGAAFNLAWLLRAVASLIMRRRRVCWSGVLRRWTRQVAPGDRSSGARRPL